MQPIRCCLAKGSHLWVGYWNKVHVVDINTKKVEVKKQRQKSQVYCLWHIELTIIIYLTSQKIFTVSEHSEQQVRFLCAAGSGVWASCRLDPILRLFEWSTERPLQEVDLSVLVTKTLGDTTV